MKESTNEILVLEEYCPFTDHLYEIEKERQEEGRFKFVIFSGNDGWRIRGVNVSSESFALRKQLLPNSLGLRGEELCKSCGIEGCVFVHISGFMGINTTKEGALAMAMQSLSPVCFNEETRVLTHSIMEMVEYGIRVSVHVYPGIQRKNLPRRLPTNQIHSRHILTAFCIMRSIFPPFFFPPPPPLR